MIKKVLSAITITTSDTDCSIMDKVSERIGRKILFVDWFGESGSGARGTMYLEVVNGGEPEKVPFRAQAKPSRGGAFEIGDWIVPYIELGYDHDEGALVESLERKLIKDGTLRRME